MDSLITYLTSLQGHIFKLLPMREAYENGLENHLFDYIDNLYSNCAGAISTYPAFSTHKSIIEACNNLAFLKDNPDVSFKKWRSTVLRSTRLIGCAIKDYAEV